MLTVDAKLFLPISEITLNHLLGAGIDLGHEIHALSQVEIASLLLISRLPQLQHNNSLTPEQFLAKAIDISNSQIGDSDLTTFINQTESMLSQTQVRQGYRLLADFKISLLDAITIKNGDYLTTDGQWNDNFKEQHRSILIKQRVKPDVHSGKISYLTAEQSRLYREFEAQSEEQMHVQGYAGTGKSTFIMAILAMLAKTRARVLLLAHTKNQLDALVAKANPGTNVERQTFTGLAQQILPANLTSFSNQHFDRIDKSRATMPDSELIRHLGIHNFGGLNSYQIIAAVRGTVFSFCHSDSEEITEEHIPRRFKSTLDSTTRKVVGHHASQLWQTFFAPKSKDFKPQVRGYHLIKWAALNGCRIPDTYTHVILDECHNLPASVLQILNGSPQALLSLGDDYQSLKGIPPQQPGYIRERELTHSVRSSHQLEEIVNPIISAHPSKTKSLFHGNKNNRIEIEYYSAAKVPDQSSVILVSDMWGLFEWAQRIAAGRGDILLLSDYKKLDMFVQDCIELYTTGTRARHPELFRFKNWAAVARHNNNSPGFHRIDRMLERGFSYKDWQQTRARFRSSPQATYALGLIENALNHEFSSVMLTPGVFRGSLSNNQAEFSSAIYIGVTRATKRLIVPEVLRHWIEEISATSPSKVVATAS